MNESELETFWREHDPRDNKHADNLLKALTERKKEHVAASEKFSKISAVGVLLFWLIAFRQSTDLSFASVKFSNPDVLMVLLMVVLSYVAYKGMLAALHILAIERTLTAYYGACLPKAAALKLTAFTKVAAVEEPLGEFGLLHKSRSLIIDLFHAFGTVLVFAVAKIAMVAWVAFAVALPRLDGLRIIAIAVSVLFLGRSFWMFGEMMRNQLNRTSNGRIGLHLLTTYDGLKLCAVFLKLKWKQWRAGQRKTLTPQIVTAPGNAAGQLAPTRPSQTP